MEDADLLGAEKHHTDDDADNQDGELAADLGQGDSCQAEKCADDVHQKHRLPLREAEVEKPMMKRSLF